MICLKKCCCCRLFIGCYIISIFEAILNLFLLAHYLEYALADNPWFFWLFLCCCVGFVAAGFLAYGTYNEKQWSLMIFFVLFGLKTAFSSLYELLGLFDVVYLPGAAGDYIALIIWICNFPFYVYEFIVVLSFYLQLDNQPDGPSTDARARHRADKS